MKQGQHISLLAITYQKHPVFLLKSQKKKFEVFIAGSPDYQNKSTISHEQLKNWESLNYIKYLGQVEDMAELYKKIHVGILPSYREGLPKGLLEAASCGKPIITTDVPGCREIVKNEINGLLVPPKDSHELMKAMKKLILNKSLRCYPLCLRYYPLWVAT